MRYLNTYKIFETKTKVDKKIEVLKEIFLELTTICQFLKIEYIDI
jgi:hypothetical protein